MRICFVSRELVPYSGGGIGTYVAMMARTLVASGHQVHVVTQARPGLPARTPDRIFLHAVSLEDGDVARNAESYFPQRYAMGVHAALIRLHLVHAFDLVEFPEFYGEGAVALRAHRRLGLYRGVVMAVRLHTPSVLVRELNGVERLDGETAAIDVMERDSMRDADCVLSPTHSLLGMAAERFGPFARQAVVPHPFAEAWTGDLGPARGVRPNRPRILYFGRLERRKGVQLLIPALAGLVRRGLEAELVFLGGDTPTGPGETSMRMALERQLTPELQGRVRFEPARGRAELGEAIRQATLCCFPSLWENFPNVCLEAMAMGCPVVASDAGGMAEILEDRVSGLLFRAGDPHALEEALAEVISDAGLADRLADGARARLVRSYAPDKIADALVGELTRPPARPARLRLHPSASTDSPTVSVLIPFFDLAHTLPETLASLDAQTFRDFETLVVDDGSTDPESLRLLASLAGDPRVRLIRKDNGGLSSARNAGLAVARGRFVLPLDADDLLEPSFLAKAVAVLEGDPALAWCTSWVDFFSETSASCGGWIPLGHAPELMLAENVAGPCTALFRREVLDQIGGYDESFPAFEDWDVFCSLLERGLRGEVLPEFLFRYRIREGSLAHGMTPHLRHALRAKLIAKHPGLVHETTLRRVLAQAEGQAERLELGRYALVDRINAAVKRVPGLHRLAKRVLAR